MIVHQVIRIAKKPVRLLNKISRQMPASTNKNITNNDLLDTGKEMHKLDKTSSLIKMKRSFIKISHQQANFESEELELSREIDEKEQEEESIIFDKSFDEVINTSVRDPPDDKKITCDRRVQAFISQKVTPGIRECRNAFEEVRNAIATVSYRS